MHVFANFRSMRQYLLVVFLCSVSSFLIGCDGGGGSTSGSNNPPQDNPDPNENPSNPDPGSDEEFPASPGGKLVDMTVVLPTSLSSTELSDLTVTTMFLDASVTTEGEVQVPYNIDEAELVTVSNSNNDIVLLGFVNDIASELSVRSTAGVLLYFGLGITFAPYEYKQQYTEQYEQLDGFDQFYDALNIVAEQDGFFLENNAYNDALEEAVSKMRQSTAVNDFTDTRNLLITEGDEWRSGLRLNNVSSDSLTITNSFTRRGHAFAYGDSCSVSGDNASVSYPADNPIADIAIEPTNRLSSFQSNVDKWGEGKVGKFFDTESEPIVLPVPEGYDECDFRMCIVGASIRLISNEFISPEESEKLREIYWDTLIEDIALPLFLDAPFGFGHKRVLEKTGLSGLKLDALTDAIKGVLKSTPKVADAIGELNFSKAAEEFLKVMYDTSLSSSTTRKAILNVIFNYFKNSFDNKWIHSSTGGLIPADEIFENAADKINKTWKLMDNLLKGAGYGKMGLDLARSNRKDCWSVTNTRSKVTLAPEHSVIKKGSRAELTANTTASLPDDTVFEYEWESSGNYGALFNPTTLQNETNFFSSSNTVSYRATSNDSLLGPGSNIDTVTVTVYTRQVGQERIEIGREQVTVDVRKSSYQVKPDGAEIQGGSIISLDLYDIETDERLSSTSTTNYMVRWSSDVQYGLLEGSASNIDTDLGCSLCGVNYEATDLEVERGTDEVTAKIYQERVPSGSGDYSILVDEVTARVTVSNEDNVIIRHLPISYWEKAGGGPNGNGLSLSNGLEVAPEPGATNYSFKVLEINYSTIPPTLGFQDSWAVDENNVKLPSPACCRWTLEPGPGWQIPLVGTGFSDITNQEDGVARARAEHSGISGLIELKITIDPERL